MSNDLIGPASFDDYANNSIEDNRETLLCYAEKHEGHLEQATEGSVGYDLYTPEPIHLKPGQGCMVDTGIAIHSLAYSEPIFPFMVLRSSAGCDHNLTLKNTVGIIDPDYCGPDDTLKAALFRRQFDHNSPGDLLLDVTLEFGYGGYDKKWIKNDSFMFRILSDYLTRRDKYKHDDYCDVDEYKSLKQASERYSLNSISEQAQWEQVGARTWRVIVKEPTAGDSTVTNVLYEEAERFAQVVFLKYASPKVQVIIDRDEYCEKTGVDENRGGFGSTGK